MLHDHRIAIFVFVEIKGRIENDDYEADSDCIFVLIRDD